MDIPGRASRPLGLPSIHIEDSNPHSRFRASASRSSSYHSVASPTSIPMSIPNAREPVPPPLPPPKHLADIASGGNNGPDIAWKWGNSADGNHGWGGSFAPIAPGSSLHGGGSSSRKPSAMDEHIEHSRRPSSASTMKPGHGADRDVPVSRFDEGYHSLSGTSIGSNRSKQDSRSFSGSVHDQYRNVQTDAYDKSLLQKLDARRGSDNKTPPRGYPKAAFSSSANESSPTTRIAIDHRHSTQLKPLSLPIITSRAHLTESPVARMSDTPISSGISPGSSYPRFSGSGNYDYKPSSDAMDYERSPLSYSRPSTNDSSHSSHNDSVLNNGRVRGSFDARISPDNDDFHTEEAGMKRLRIGDHQIRYEMNAHSSAAGQKRRASSPPVDGPTLHTAGSATDLYRRRESAARASPGPPYHINTNSTSSMATAPRNNSYASTMSLSAGSITSLSSFGRVSPGGISPNTEGSDSPYVNSMSLTSSPRGSLSRQGGHQRGPSDTRPNTARRLSEITNGLKSSIVPRMQGPFLCECCPKKPKKFDSQEELNAHEQEKQYECAYCKNRFKNKNEAERHQNSLHLRRHSWSCAALSGYEAVFHVSTTRADSDTCGFCGEDFLRTGISSPSQSHTPVSIPSEQDWEVRIIHLQEMHKFGECNHAKKFFRADHFRQHLKHSHAGTSGKWTNMLENACMKEEPLPEPLRQPERINTGGSRVGMISEEDELS